MDEESIQQLYAWIDEITLSRPKRNIARDFSDGVLAAEIVGHFVPSIVEIHNYTPANNSQQKRTNWETLNRKVFKKLEFNVPSNIVNGIIMCKPGVIEIVLFNLRVKILNYTAKTNAETEESESDYNGLSQEPEVWNNTAYYNNMAGGGGYPVPQPYTQPSHHHPAPPPQQHFKPTYKQVPDSTYTAPSLSHTHSNYTEVSAAPTQHQQHPKPPPPTLPHRPSCPKPPPHRRNTLRHLTNTTSQYHHNTTSQHHNTTSQHHNTTSPYNMQEDNVPSAPSYHNTQYDTQPSSLVAHEGSLPHAMNGTIPFEGEKAKKKKSPKKKKNPAHQSHHSDTQRSRSMPSSFAHLDHESRIFIQEKEQALLHSQETVQILQSKIGRLEHLLQLKDLRIEDLDMKLKTALGGRR